MTCASNAWRRAFSASREAHAKGPLLLRLVPGPGRPAPPALWSLSLSSSDSKPEEEAEAEAAEAGAMLLMVSSRSASLYVLGDIARRRVRIQRGPRCVRRTAAFGDHLTHFLAKSRREQGCTG